MTTPNNNPPKKLGRPPLYTPDQLRKAATLLTQAQYVELQVHCARHSTSTGAALGAALSLYAAAHPGEFDAAVWPAKKVVAS